MRHNDKYILIDRDVVPCDDFLMWGTWLEVHHDACIIKQEKVGPHYWVSTVFMGIDMNLRRCMALAGENPDDYGPPLLFETLAFEASNEFGGRKATACGDRCSTYDEAEAQHARIVAEIAKAVYA